MLRIIKKDALGQAKIDETNYNTDWQLQERRHSNSKLQPLADADGTCGVVERARDNGGKTKAHFYQSNQLFANLLYFFIIVAQLSLPQITSSLCPKQSHLRRLCSFSRLVTSTTRSFTMYTLDPILARPSPQQLPSVFFHPLLLLFLTLPFPRPPLIHTFTLPPLPSSPL